jgi:hypothetical protein
MEVSKVQLANGKVLVDLTNDSVTEETLAEGATAHDASGARITGTMKSGGGVSVQSDWNQTDETAADFIKNKPFGDTHVVILEEQELAFDAEMYGCIGVLSAPIQFGDFLSIVADGESYECEAIDFNGNIAFGNLAFGGVGEDTGEPFLGTYFDGMVMFAFMDELNHIVGIAKVNVTKIPNRYYNAQTIFYLSDPYVFTDAGRTTKATKNDVITAVKKGLLCLEAGDIYVYPVYINCTGNYAVISCQVGGGAVQMKMDYYTAEYTPET